METPPSNSMVLEQYSKSSTLAILLLLFTACWGQSGVQEDFVKLPTKCETCKYVALELEQRLAETGKSHEVLRSSKGVAKKYRDSELRFLESLEGLCERFTNDYNVHKEYTDSRRFARGQSETMKTLHGLVEKGVKVELGIPEELWDSPTVEVAEMRRNCEQMLEEFEEDLEKWYFDHMDSPLVKYLCQERALRGQDSTCLLEGLKPQKGDHGEL